MLRAACLPLALLAAPAAADGVACDQRARVVAKLTGLGEAQIGAGLTETGQVFEIWTSPRTGTWTIVLSDSKGLSCILSYGRDWTGGAGLQGDPT